MTHERFVVPLWKQGLGSTIHCLAGDATGIIAAAVASLLGWPMWVDAIAEYVFGFAFGLLVFQALFMRDMVGGSYRGAVRTTVLPEWLSMNAVMAGMIPVMVVLMSQDPQAMEATRRRRRRRRDRPRTACSRMLLVRTPSIQRVTPEGLLTQYPTRRPP